jgi:hypothetical protein
MEGERMTISDQLYTVTSFPPLWWLGYAIAVRIAVKKYDAHR